MKLERSIEDPYALRALVYLARDADWEELVTADSFSAEAVVPRRPLARVIQFPSSVVAAGAPAAVSLR